MHIQPDKNDGAAAGGAERNTNQATAEQKLRSEVPHISGPTTPDNMAIAFDDKKLKGKLFGGDDVKKSQFFNNTWEGTEFKEEEDKKPTRDYSGDDAFVQDIFKGNAKKAISTLKAESLKEKFGTA